VLTLFEVAFGEVEEPLALDINVFVEALYMCCQMKMKTTTIRFAKLLFSNYSLEAVRALPPGNKPILMKALWPGNGELNWDVCLGIAMLLGDSPEMPWDEE
jgi:hypothetical protein